MATKTLSPFCIKAGYRENPGPVYFVDDVHEREDPIVFQPDVLPRAAEIAEEIGTKTIIDVGCGQATKLAALHDEQPGLQLIGVDYGENLRWCQEHYPWGQWYELDLELADQDFEYPPAIGAVVVASDVIEHLVDPRPMLRWIRRATSGGDKIIGGEPRILISTPERDLQFGPEHRGPSPNLCHVREWNRVELRTFLEQEGFEVLDMGLTRSNDRGPAENTILAVCR